MAWSPHGELSWVGAGSASGYLAEKSKMRAEENRMRIEENGIRLEKIRL